MSGSWFTAAKYWARVGALVVDVWTLTIRMLSLPTGVNVTLADSGLLTSVPTVAWTTRFRLPTAWSAGMRKFSVSVNLVGSTEAIGRAMTDPIGLTVKLASPLTVSVPVTPG